MKKVFLILTLMVGGVLYFKNPPVNAEIPQAEPAVKEEFKIDIKALQDYNKKGITQIVEKRKATEKQMEFLADKVVLLNKDNANLVKRINTLEDAKIELPVEKDTAQVDSVKIKTKRSFIKRLLNKN
jgi:hypothetical protein